MSLAFLTIDQAIEKIAEEVFFNKSFPFVRFDKQEPPLRREVISKYCDGTYSRCAYARFINRNTGKKVLLPVDDSLKRININKTPVEWCLLPKAIDQTFFN